MSNAQAVQETAAVYESHLEDRKLQKRAANRRSAQLSRKRRKQFMEELKEENDTLRRKEQILRSIPDLIVVFDSAGKLWFVSESVSRFIKFQSKELEGSSIWDRLCEDSVRLLKAAFMDSMAARDSGSDTAPLGSGLWELRLVDRDGSHKVVTMNGVVHFAGERPECVCTIRPSGIKEEEKKKKDSEEKPRSKPFVRVKPHQSVVSNGSSDASLMHHKAKRANLGNAGVRGVVRISDSGNSSGSGNSFGNSSGGNSSGESGGGDSSGECESGSGSGSSDE
jgi:PAS domain S-box-containing protein